MSRESEDLQNDTVILRFKPDLTISRKNSLQIVIFLSTLSVGFPSTVSSSLVDSSTTHFASSARWQQDNIKNAILCNDKFRHAFRVGPFEAPNGAMITPTPMLYH